MAFNLAPFGRWTLRDKAAQRRLTFQSADESGLESADDALHCVNQMLDGAR